MYSCGSPRTAGLRIGVRDSTSSFDQGMDWTVKQCCVSALTSNNLAVTAVQGGAQSKPAVSRSGPPRASELVRFRVVWPEREKPNTIKSACSHGSMIQMPDIQNSETW